MTVWFLFDFAMVFKNSNFWRVKLFSWNTIFWICLNSEFKSETLLVHILSQSWNFFCFLLSQKWILFPNQNRKIRTFFKLSSKIDFGFCFEFSHFGSIQLRNTFLAGNYSNKTFQTFPKLSILSNFPALFTFQMNSMNSFFYGFEFQIFKYRLQSVQWLSQNWRKVSVCSSLSSRAKYARPSGRHTGFLSTK